MTISITSTPYAGARYRSPIESDRDGQRRTVQVSPTAGMPAWPVAADGVLFNPRTYDAADLDPESRRLMLATIDFFESRGKAALKERRPRARLVRRLPRVRQRASASSPRC